MKLKDNEKGFTLIELMAVLVILGILATVVVVSVDPVFQRANLEKIRADLKNPFLYPQGGYISAIPKDPWGREYIYEYPSRRTQKYDLYTLGADGIEGGSGEDADVGNWMQQ